MRRPSQQRSGFAASGARTGERKEAAVARGKPPAPPPDGNKRALTHGAYARVAEKRLSAKVREVFDAIAEDAPVYEAPDAIAVRLLAETLCRLDDVRAYIAEHGLFKPKVSRKRDPMRALEMEDRLMKRALDMLDALAMTPRSRAKLGLDTARQFDLAQTWAEQDEKARTRRRRGAIEGRADDA